MTQFNTGLPSIIQIQNWIKETKEVELKLITGDLLLGQILWQDENCFCLIDKYKKPTLISRMGIVYLKPKR